MAVLKRQLETSLDTEVIVSRVALAAVLRKRASARLSSGYLLDPTSLESCRVRRAASVGLIGTPSA
jgi:hypothetical protein